MQFSSARDFSSSTLIVIPSKARDHGVSLRPNRLRREFFGTALNAVDAARGASIMIKQMPRLSVFFVLGIR